MYDLQIDTSIVIKPADKGGAIVIQNNVDYVRECERQLSDLDFYKKLSGDPTQMFKHKIHSALDFMFQTGEIIKRQLDFLKIKNPVISTFYTLPKIHKRLELPPDHPIVAGIGSLTSSISTFCGFLFKTLL